ncbi:minor tail protein [Arthrobacter phage SerialPhiller]|nr:hypothetical protein SEA_KELS_12 [Arthrobacter phage Kels]WNO27595.1 hypothetical protein SEA_ARIELAGOS_12 [Arthrobacter phage Arielagos]WNT45244.1 minor tail protein [Arthrobacter phage SerialPhiller]
MVTITNPGLSLAGGVMHPSKDAAFILPTAFAGLQITYGGDSCSDHPQPGSAAGSVFIPAQHAAFYPRLADPVTLRATINGEDTRIFYGTIDDLIVEDVAGDELPAIIPNSRHMQSLAGWTITQGTSRAGAVALPADYLVDGARVSATGPQPGGLGSYVYIAAPAAPINTARAYVVTAMAQSPVGYPYLSVEWINAAGAVVQTDELYSYYIPPSLQGDYYALHTATFWPPMDAVKACIVAASELDPTAEPWEQAVGIDGLVLHELPAGVYTLPRYKRPAGRYVKFKASDILATAARLIVGDTPWPQQTIENRTAALNDLVPAGAVSFGFGSADPFALLGPRDIDKQNMLEIYQRILASAGDLAIAATAPARFIAPASLPRFPMVIADDGTGTAVIITDPLVPELPAGAIEYGPLQTDVTTMSNQIRVEYRQITDTMSQTAEDAAQLYSNDESVAAFGAMARSVTTDLSVVEGSRAEAKARRLAVAQATPFYRMADNVKLVEAAIPEAANVARLYSADYGFGQLVRIPDAPSLLGQYHRIKAASITFGKPAAVELDIEPSDYAAPEPVSFGETFGQPFDTLTLSAFAGITLGDLTTTSAQEF